MAKSTLIIIGPGGIGKSPIDDLLPNKVIRLDPYRLRSDGPRDNNDRLYAPPKLHEELTCVFNGFGDAPIKKITDDEYIEWFPQANVVFFTVRGVWQFIIVPNDTGALAKMEIYAPILPTLMTIDEFVKALGSLKIIVLNPAVESISSMSDWSELEKCTRHNCKERGDSDKSIDKRVSSIATEATYWRELVVSHNAIEAIGWEYPEYIYKENPDSRIKAKKCLLNLDGTLNEFF
jgi:hypothetical protein